MYHLWNRSECFKDSVIGSLEAVLKDESLIDPSLPEPTPEPLDVEDREASSDVADVVLRKTLGEAMDELEIPKVGF